MSAQRPVPSGVRIALLLAGLLVGGPSSVAMACLAHYRSPEWQVAHSPLIIVGEVESIEAAPPPAHASRSRIEEDEGESRHATPPTVATVRILRVLKGRYPEPRIRIGSGPIPTCGGDVHCRFTVGECRLFLLPADPQQGVVALHFAGSVLPLKETTLIESRIARAIAYRAEYLENLQQEKPAVYAAAVHLADALRAESKQWPSLDYDAETNEENQEFQAALAKLEQRLAPVDADTIVAAQAIDWWNPEPNLWWRHELWDQVIRQLGETRPKEAVAVQYAWIRRTLADAGVEETQINDYLEVVGRDDGRGWLTFPIKPPSLWNTLQKNRDGAALTTDFILHYYAYDRGGMLVAYAPTFNAGVLKDLDMRRIKPLVASLYQSDGERLRWLVRQAISYVPGTECVDIVLNDLVEEGHDQAWRVLANRQKPEEVALRLAALIDQGTSGYTVWGQATLWRMLKKGQCFEETCLEKALSALESLEESQREAGEKKTEPAAETPREDAALAEALREYLAAAKASREEASPARLTAAAYRQWFQTHPTKEKGGEE